MKKNILIFLMVANLPCFGQQALIAIGETIVTSSGSVSFSIGQLNYVSEENNSHLIIEGVQQPILSYTNSIAELNNKNRYPEITVSPNPTSNYIQLLIKRKNATDQLQYHICDITGRQLLKGNIVNSFLKIDLSQLSTGSYLMGILQDNQLIKSFKIIKSD